MDAAAEPLAGGMEKQPMVSEPQPPPPPRRIPCKEWGRLLVIWVCCSAASGLIPGQAMFVDMFAKAGVYGSMCEDGPPPCSHQITQLSGMFGTGAMLNQIFGLPAGILFDIYGARWLGVAGTLVSAVGLFFEGVVVLSAALGADAYTSWLVLPGAVVTDVGSVMGSFTLMGFVWHFPGSMTLIMSLITATYQVSALLPMILQRIMDWTGLPLAWAMFGYAVAILACVPLMSALTPTMEDYYKQAKEVLGVPLPKPKATFDICNRLATGWKAVRADMRDHLWLSLGVAFASTMAMMYSSSSAAYGKQLFGTQKDGDQLAQMQVLTVTIASAIGAPFGAKVVDAIGLKNFIWLMMIFIVVPAVLFSRADWWAAWATTWGYTIYYALSQLVLSRYYLFYAPPNHLGSYGGVIMIFLLATTLPVYFIWLAFTMGLPEDDCFFLPFLSLNICALVSMFVWNVRSCFAHDGRGFPMYPRMLPEDEMELCMSYGAANMGELSQITGLDKQALLKRMSDNDPASMNELMALVDLEKVAEIAKNRDADTLIMMLETAPETEEEAVGDRQAQHPADPSYSALHGPLMSPRSVSTQASQADVESEAKAQRSGVAARAKALAQDLRAALDGESPDARAAVLRGARGEEDVGLRGLQARVLAEVFVALVAEGNAEMCKRLLLEAPVEGQIKCFDMMGGLMGEQERAAFDAKFNKLVPAKQFAPLLKQNPDLKGLVAHFMVQEMRKSMEYSVGKEAPEAGAQQQG